MKKKFFIPVDDSIYTVQAMQYMAAMAPVFQDADYILFHVQPKISDYIREESRKDPAAMEELKKFNNRNEALGKELLEDLKKRMIRMGVAKDKITVSTRRCREGRAKDIIDEARVASADAIVMGRRGVSRFADTFIGSTTKNVIEHNPDIPVWMISGEAPSKNILLAVDGSVDSAKALDYLLDMLREDPDAGLTLFHVQASLRDTCGLDFEQQADSGEEKAFARVIEKAGRQCIDNFMELARGKLKEKKINENRLNLKIVPARFDITGAILEEFKNQGHGTLVIGKRGMNKRFFMGSVSNYLIRHMENGALCIVP